MTQFEVMPMPPEQENKPLVWPYWPLKLRTSSSHARAQKGCEREFAISTKEFIGENGKVTGLKTVQRRVQGRQVRSKCLAPSRIFKADLVLLAMGFVNPVATLLEGFGVEKDARGNAKATTDCRRLRDQRAQGVRCRRHAPWPVAGGVGDPRRPPGRARGRTPS